MVLSRCRQLRYAVFSPEWLKRAYTTAGNDLDRGFQSYISSSNDPFLNLSIEHHLLQKASKTSTVLLLYVNRPCVVIGRNQNPWTEVNLSLLSPGRPGSTAALSALGPIDLVRRRSGGGTVFHDAGNVNWTVISPSDSFTRDKHAEMVVRALRRSGIARSRVNERHDIVLDLNGETGSPNAPKWGSEDDTHRTPWQGQPDIRTVKVSGSAYKLTRGRALHHGTALLNSPNLAALRAVLSAPGKPFIESKGVASVSSPVANIGLDNDEFTGVVQAEFAKMYHCDSLAPAVVDETWLEDSEVAKGYEELKSLDWTYLQTPRFSVNYNADGLQASLAVRNGRIDQFAVDLDPDHSFDVNDLQARLQGQAVHEVQSWEQLFDVSPSGSGSDSVRRFGSWLQMALPSYGTQLEHMK